MKKLLFVLLFIPILVNSQEIKIEFDEFEKSTTVTSEFFKNGKFDLKQSAGKNRFFSLNALYYKPKNKEGYFFIDILLVSEASKITCLSEYKGKITFLLENDTTLECLQISRTDCDSGLIGARYIAAPSMKVVSYAFTSSHFLLLSHLSIKKIRIATTDGNIDIEIDEDYKEYLKNCFKKVHDKGEELKQ
ncbi:MAG: hypothetical protein BM557_09655 [Flavobacterium sp. MedPE-SWcel]|uniref:hypothetical protein n=1 Tax=uncultured Flavobacterium sp. TaxID=165435 RepID=UPI00091C483A|nr:hypothetical protein [uncultured Flavobacterium sp.]OIQ16569.1 MAG: hypothetical protein BM557_09655 [Flavobacterium sp. MedPE-SWcel]